MGNLPSPSSQVFGAIDINEVFRGGGPQPEEVQRMLAVEREKVVVEFAWLKDRAGALARADAALDQDFNALAR